MIINAKLSALKEGRWYEYVIRFALGGATTLIAGIIGDTWEPDFILIYNDGYRPILGDKHPRALGLPFREVWPEVQTDLLSLHETILSGERSAFFQEDLLLRIQRHGSQWENARFTISYSPIPDDAAPT